MLKHANRGALPAMLVLGVLIGASLAVISPSRLTRVVPSATMPVTVTPGVPGDDEAGGSAGAAEPHARPGKVENGGGDSSGTDASGGGGGSGGTASADSATAGGTGSGGAGGSGSGGSGGEGSASTGSGSTGGDGSASTGSDKSNNGKAKGHFDGKGRNG
jgi:hypothetical protein